MFPTQIHHGEYTTIMSKLRFSIPRKFVPAFLRKPLPALPPLTAEDRINMAIMNVNEALAVFDTAARKVEQAERSLATVIDAEQARMAEIEQRIADSTKLRAQYTTMANNLRAFTTLPDAPATPTPAATSPQKDVTPKTNPTTAP